MFSIIIPLYNRSHTIQKAINSVLDQTYTDFEIIVVDDCSIDDGLEKVKAYNDNRLRFLKNEQNSGAASARNNGIKVANRDFITFLDSDDFYEPTFLEETLKIISISKESVGFWYTGYRIINECSIKEKTWRPIMNESPYLTVLNQLQIGSGAGITVRKKVFEVAGLFRADLPAAEDTEFFFRISKLFDFKLVDKILVNIVVDGDDRMSKNFRNIGIAYNRFISEHLEEINKNKNFQKKFFYKMMWLNYYIPSKTISRHYLKLLFKSNNINFKILFIFILYEVLPIKYAAKIHQDYSSN